MEIPEAYVVENRNHEDIHHESFMGNLNEGIEIELHDIPTRLVAWPGNGFQKESTHVLTLAPGVVSSLYHYQISAEALVCIQGKGEIYLQGKWVELEVGEVAYFPENTTHGIRNPLRHSDDFILVSTIKPPAHTLYAMAGFYIRELGIINLEKVAEAKRNAVPGTLSNEIQHYYKINHSQFCAENIKVSHIKRKWSFS